MRRPIGRAAGKLAAAILLLAAGSPRPGLAGEAGGRKRPNVLFIATADAHPIHIHEVLFQAVSRQVIFVDESNRKSGWCPALCHFRPCHGKQASRTQSSPTRVRSPG